MNGTVTSLLTELKVGLQRIYGERLEGVYLYGSYARGDYDDESDVDVLIVLDRIERYGAEIDRTGGLTAAVSLDFGVTVSTVFVSADAWHTEESPFLDNVRDDAVPA